ncbi:MAG: 30S ribosomal protein S6 [Patescibacteria group bacterium]|nr:30S ribosomal protein S6 [Patescibacteria group bacterium]
MQKYELLFILPAKYTDAELVEMSNKVKGICENTGVKVTETHHLGRRRLAYPIKNVRNGNYILFYFESDAAAAAKLNDVLRLTTDILRHLVTTRDPHLTKIPSLVEEEPRRDRDRDERPARFERPAPPPPPKEKVNIEELDKKLDQILTEEIL